MARWRQYGPVWVSSGICAGILATATWFWQRESALVYRIDVAELTAARTEKIVAFHTGSNAPAVYPEPSSNLVDAVLWGYLPNVSTSYCTTVTVTYAGSPAHVRVLTNAYVFTTADWRDTRQIVFWSTNKPYGGADSFQWTVADENGNIGAISTLNGGTGGGLVTYGEETNAPYAWAPTFLQIPYGVQAATALIRLSAPTNNPHVTTNWTAVWEPRDQPGAVSDNWYFRTLYDGVMRAARDLAVMPAERSQWLAGMTGGTDYAFDDTYKRVFWADTRDAPLEDGQTVLAAGAGEWTSEIGVIEVIDGATEHKRIVWYAPQATNVEERTAVTETRWPKAGTRFAPGLAATNLPFAKAVMRLADGWTEADATNIRPSAAIAARDGWWTAIGCGTNAYRYWCEKPDATNGIAYLSRGTYRTNLTEALRVLTNLTRTVCVMPIGYCEVSAGQSVERRYQTSRTDSATGTFPAFAGDAGWTWMATPYYDATNTHVSVMYAGLLAQYEASAVEGCLRQWYDTEVENDQTYSYDYAASYSYKAYRYTLKSPYPSEFACAQSNVVKIRVFALPYAGYDLGQITVGPAWHNSDFSSTLEGGSTHVDQYDWGLFSHVGGMLPHPALSHTAGESHYLGGIHLNPGSFGETRLALIGEWDNPTNRPTFEIGTNALPRPPLSAEAAHAYADWSYLDTTGGDRHRERQAQHQFEMSVACPAIVVEVWWRWRHATGAAPAEHRPEWAQTNGL